MFDIRYHIASLVAVFLALALGILLGTVIVDKGLMAKQQEALVARLESEYKEIKDENTSLKKQLAADERFRQDIMSLSIKGKLSGKRIAIFSTPEMEATLKSKLQDAFSQAETQSCFVSLLASDFRLEDQKTKKELNNLFSQKNLSKDELRNKLIEKLAQEIATQQERTLTKKLVELGLLKVDNEASLPADVVVIFASGKEKQQTFSQTHSLLANQLQRFEKRVVGAETLSAEVSHITEFQVAGVSTVDDVDTVAGRIALVFLLSGGQGNFGSKPTAQSYLPNLNF